VLGQSPSEPLFTASPTPSADEPRTPMSVWGEGIRSILVEEVSGFEWEVCGVSDAHSGFWCFGEDWDYA
jgi:hypothetical protein